MRRSYILLLSLLAACSSCAGTFQPPEVPSVDDPTYASSYRLRVLCPDLSGSAGSAVAISSQHLLTARHVVDCDGVDPLQITAIDMAGESFDVDLDLLPVDGTDAARLVSITRKLPSWSTLSYRNPPLGELVCIVGGDSPDIRGMRKCGYVAPSVEEYLTVALHVVPGNSGGPAFDSYGYVLGIVSMGNWNASSENYVLLVPSKELKGLVN
jgi:S1-C subfamily serine protease